MPYRTMPAEQIRDYLRNKRPRPFVTDREEQFILFLDEIVFLMNSGQDIYTTWRYLITKWNSRNPSTGSFMSSMTFCNIFDRLHDLLWLDADSESLSDPSSIPFRISDESKRISSLPPVPSFDEQREEWLRFFAIRREFNVSRLSWPQPHYRREALLS